MKTATTSLAICLAVLAIVPTAHGQDAPAALHPLGARDQLIAAFDALPDAPLREFFLRCSSEGNRRMLPLEDAVPCAVAWDTLLRREYRGNIEALLAWWRQHRDDFRQR